MGEVESVEAVSGTRIRAAEPVQPELIDRGEAVATEPAGVRPRTARSKVPCAQLEAIFDSEDAEELRTLYGLPKGVPVPGIEMSMEQVAAQSGWWARSHEELDVLERLADVCPAVALEVLRQPVYTKQAIAKIERAGLRRLKLATFLYERGQRSDADMARVQRIPANRLEAVLAAYGIEEPPDAEERHEDRNALVLAALSRAGGRSVQQVAECLKLSLSAAGHMLRAMRRAGSAHSVEQAHGPELWYAGAEQEVA